MPEPIEKLWEQPKPKTVIVFGKGPSLDLFDVNLIGDATCFGINEAGMDMPCPYMVYMDRHISEIDIPSSVVPIRTEPYAEKHNGRGYVYDKSGSFRESARKYMRCTASVVTGILGEWGVGEINYVGFDGWDRNDGETYANRLHIVHPRKNANYDKLNRYIRGAIDIYGISPHFFHRDHAICVERLGYQTIYEEAYRVIPNYGAKGHGEPFVELVDSLLPRGGTLVDVGAGKHTFSKLLSTRRPDANIYDIDIIQNGTPEHVHALKCPGWDLSGVTERVDELVSFDFLEHLYNEDIDRTLQAWAEKLRGHLVCTIAHFSCRMNPPILGAGNLHPSANDRQWWQNKLSQFFDDVKVHADLGRSTCFAAKSKEGGA